MEGNGRSWKIMEDCRKFHESLWKSLEMFGRKVLLIIVTRRKVYKGGLPPKSR